MKTEYLVVVSLFSATIALQGCKHPLAIVGEGDIVDANNSGRGCTLEQFRAGDGACTENNVSGDYFVNYKAEPRPGWRFVRWEGPCPPDSDFQYCRFEIAKEAVAWWDATYPDKQIPPSTAVFQPIEGETGYLLAGTPVAGVTYQTPTQQGVTGSDGSFQYGEGETVRFSIGDTLLGEVNGQARVTPFDLVGSGVITGPDLSGALETPSFQAAINLAVLLQSLDQDADPHNGIQIGSGVAELFRGVKLELAQQYGSFQDASTLRRVLGRANREHRFGDTHDLVKPAVAAAQLYAGLGIDPLTFGLRQGQILDANGNLQHTERFQYDAAGNLIRHDAGTPDQFESWQYDIRGNVTRHERNAEEYNLRRIAIWQYDANGNLMQFLNDNNADGSLEENVTYQRNADGNVMLEITPEGEKRFNYDARGNLVFAEAKNAGDDTPYSIETWRYETQGNIRQYERSQPLGLNSYLVEQYDANRNITRSEYYYYLDSEYNEHRIDSYEYDVKGNLTRVEQDHNADGIADNIIFWTYQYDINGKLTHKESMNSANSNEDTVESWQYDASGRLTRYESSIDQHLQRWLYRSDGSLALIDSESTEENDDGIYITESHLFWYDSRGNLTRSETAVDGTKTGITNWRYDGDNNLMRAEDDTDANGSPDSIETWQYDESGNITRYERDENGDGKVDSARVMQYEPTGWGHFFLESSSIGYFGSLSGKPAIP